MSHIDPDNVKMLIYIKKLFAFPRCSYSIVSVQLSFEVHPKNG